MDSDDMWRDPVAEATRIAACFDEEHAPGYKYSVTLRKSAVTPPQWSLLQVDDGRGKAIIDFELPTAGERVEVFYSATKTMRRFITGDEVDAAKSAMPPLQRKDCNFDNTDNVAFCTASAPVYYYGDTSCKHFATKLAELRPKARASLRVFVDALERDSGPAAFRRFREGAAKSRGRM